MTITVTLIKRTKATKWIKDSFRRCCRADERIANRAESATGGNVVMDCDDNDGYASIVVLMMMIIRIIIIALTMMLMLMF